MAQKWIVREGAATLMRSDYQVQMAHTARKRGLASAGPAQGQTPPPLHPSGRIPNGTGPSTPHPGVSHSAHHVSGEGAALLSLRLGGLPGSTSPPSPHLPRPRNFPGPHSLIPPIKRARAGQNRRKDRRCQHKTGETENQGTPNTPPREERSGGWKGLAAEEARELPEPSPHIHSHTNRTMDPLNNVECRLAGVHQCHCPRFQRNTSQLFTLCSRFGAPQMGVWPHAAACRMSAATSTVQNPEPISL